jgi:DedD protein
MARMQIPQRFAQFWSRWSMLRPEAPEAQALDPVALARLRARRRLIGAVALVLVALIVFPLFFETQPRPIPADVAIEMPGLEPHAAQGATPAPMAAPNAAEPASQVQVAPATAAERPPATELAEPEPHLSPAPPLAASGAVGAAPTLGTAPQRVAVATAADTPPAVPAGGSERFVVQIGAYAEAKSAQDVRIKVERAGLKTYTHVIDTPSGKRIRVRVGPLTQREEAEKVLAQLKALGLGGSILVL